eukprot:8575643-Lingulodinium_polyedra.AAC.1
MQCAPVISLTSRIVGPSRPTAICGIVFTGSLRARVLVHSGARRSWGTPRQLTWARASSPAETVPAILRPMPLPSGAWVCSCLLYTSPSPRDA